MSLPTIEQLLSSIPSSLGSYGPVLDEIDAALESPQCSLVTVAEAIEKDPDLTARLLRLGNSPFYGFSTRLATVTEVISLIGIQQVQDLLIASSTMERFAGVSERFVSMESFWRHSLACGIGARLIATERRSEDPDKFFLAGLLHDVGRLVLFGHAPQAAHLVFERYQRERVLLREAEVQVLGYDHQQVAEALLTHWTCPSNIVRAAAFHHQPMSSPACEEAAAVHVADHLVNAMGIGSSGERHAPPLNMQAWEALGLSTQSLPAIVAGIDDQIETVEAVFLHRQKT